MNANCERVLGVIVSAIMALPVRYFSAKALPTQNRLLATCKHMMPHHTVLV